MVQSIHQILVNIEALSLYYHFKIQQILKYYWLCLKVPLIHGNIEFPIHPSVRECAILLRNIMIFRVPGQQKTTAL